MRTRELCVATVGSRGHALSLANKLLLQVTSGGGQRRQTCWPQQAVYCQPAQKHNERPLLTPTRPFILGNSAYPPNRKPLSTTCILACPSTMYSVLHSPWPDLSGMFFNFWAARQNTFFFIENRFSFRCYILIKVPLPSTPPPFSPHSYPPNLHSFFFLSY